MPVRFDLADAPPENCGSCRFSSGRISADGSKLEDVLCRRGLRHIPAAPLMNKQRVLWPLHSIYDWCGEYQRDTDILRSPTDGNAPAS